MYLHRLIVRRKDTGLGGDVIEWACQRAGQLGNHWVRIDVWTDNIDLHRYYERNGFRHVRTLDLGDYPSGALWQRRVRFREGDNWFRLRKLTSFAGECGQRLTELVSRCCW